MRRVLLYLFLLMAFIWAGPLQAQLPSPRPNPSSKDGKYERVHSIILMRLSTVLGLSSAQTQQMGSILSKHHAKKRQLRREVQELTAQLRSTMTGGNSGQTQAAVAKLDRARRQLSGLNDEMYAEARRMLNPQQQAQFMLVMDEVKREVRSVRDQGPATGDLAPGSNPYTPGSPYFPAPAIQGGDNVWVR